MILSNTVVGISSTKIIVVMFGISLLTTSIVSQSYALPSQTYEQYKQKIDQAKNEKSSPLRQIRTGIQLFDVTCFDNKIPILKLSSGGYVACINSGSVDSLVKIGWGWPKNETKIMMQEDGHGGECKGTWLVGYDESKPLESSLVKALRLAMKDHAAESLMWQQISVTDFAYKKTITLDAGGLFTFTEQENIVNALEKINNVLDVKYKAPSACL